MKVKANLIMGKFEELEPYFDFIRKHCEPDSEYQVFTEGGEFVYNISYKAFMTLKTKIEEQNNAN